jgi:hypothetical protein
MPIKKEIQEKINEKLIEKVLEENIEKKYSSDKFFKIEEKVKNSLEKQKTDDALLDLTT